MNNEIIVRANRVRRRKQIRKISKIVLVILLLALLIIFLILKILYNRGNFSITLDKNLYYKNNIVIYDDPNYKVFRTELFAETVEALDDIHSAWLPDDLEEHDGSHNGDNYIAYTFYIENMGTEMTYYYAELEILEVINNVDEAIRIRVYRDGDEVTYAKMGRNGQPEINTTPFLDEQTVYLEQVKDFKPDDIHKYTIVVWIEGKDPDCTDNIIGGEIKINMTFNSEFIEKKEIKKK